MRERTSTLHGPLRRASVAAMLLAMGFAGPAAWAQAADDPAPPKAEAAPVAPSESLRAVFIDVGGKVQWRPGEQDAWRDAKVNDVIAPGAEVRTGLRSHAALRVGRNATALVDAGTVFQIPSVVKEGDALRTTVSVKSGRADFKVDKVGFANDFKVVTPSMTLAVRGTGFAVATGALKQVEVLGARRNAIAAIELKYALSSTTVAMSGGASSSSALQQPTHAAVVAAAPPTTASALPTSSPTEAVREAAGGPPPSNPNAPAAQQRQTSSVAKAATSVAQANADSGSDGSSLLAAINRALVARGTELTDEAGANVAAA
ncbi:MAG: FecR domain-containing protein, partial [Phycisphaerales bacterium]